MEDAEKYNELRQAQIFLEAIVDRKGFYNWLIGKKFKDRQSDDYYIVLDVHLDLKSSRIIPTLTVLKYYQFTTDDGNTKESISITTIEFSELKIDLEKYKCLFQETE